VFGGRNASFAPGSRLAGEIDAVTWLLLRTMGGKLEANVRYAPMAEEFCALVADKTHHDPVVDRPTTFQYP
jgi:hypothetical protein